jgi:hypothetical protein
VVADMMAVIFVPAPFVLWVYLLQAQNRACAAVHFSKGSLALMCGATTTLCSQHRPEP